MPGLRESLCTTGGPFPTWSVDFSRMGKICRVDLDLPEQKKARGWPQGAYVLPWVRASNFAGFGSRILPEKVSDSCRVQVSDFSGGVGLGKGRWEGGVLAREGPFRVPDEDRIWKAAKGPLSCFRVPYLVGSSYSPSISQSLLPSPLPLHLCVPLPLMPLNLPVPPV